MVIVIIRETCRLNGSTVFSRLSTANVIRIAHSTSQCISDADRFITTDVIRNGGHIAFGIHRLGSSSGYVGLCDSNIASCIGSPHGYS